MVISDKYRMNQICKLKALLLAISKYCPKKQSFVVLSLNFEKQNRHNILDFQICLLIKHISQYSLYSQSGGSKRALSADE